MPARGKEVKAVKAYASEKVLFCSCERSSFVVVVENFQFGVRRHTGLLCIGCACVYLSSLDDGRFHIIIWNQTTLTGTLNAASHPASINRIHLED